MTASSWRTSWAEDPPALPSPARYRARQTGPHPADFDLADRQPVVLPRGVLKAIQARAFHQCTVISRPMRPGGCSACDLDRLIAKYTATVQTGGEDGNGDRSGG